MLQDYAERGTYDDCCWLLLCIFGWISLINFDSDETGSLYFLHSIITLSSLRNEDICLAREKKRFGMIKKKYFNQKNFLISGVWIEYDKQCPNLVYGSHCFGR